MSASLTRSIRALRLGARTSPSEVAANVAGPSTIPARRWDSGSAAASASGEVAPSESEGAQAASSALPSSSGASSSSPASTSSSSSPSPSPSSATSNPNPSTPTPPTQTPSKAETFRPAISHYPIPRPSSFLSSSIPERDASSLPSHKHINFPQRQFAPPAPSAKPATLGGNEQARKEAMLSATTGLSVAEIKGLRRYTVKVGRVTQMTKKGKIFTALVVVGSPTRGMVGIGYGRGAVLTKAADQGFSKAVQSMDYVNRYENRTLWGSGKDMETKWGAVKVIMRARPVGFGLMVPPALHRVFTACGIRDASATIEGSRNPVEVVKCAIQMLHGGANPPGFGSGLGGRGRREDKGRGMKSRDEIERERGRYGVDIGRRI